MVRTTTQKAPNTDEMEDTFQEIKLAIERKGTAIYAIIEFCGARKT